MMFATNNNTRIWGDCTNECINHSQVNSIELVATHFAFLLSKHYVVYANVSCPYHGNQIWTTEKFLDPGQDFVNHSHQSFQEGSNFFSCSSYVNQRKTFRVHYFNTPVTMADVIYSISSSNGYSLFLKNCRNFASKTFKDYKITDGYGSAMEQYVY